MRRGHPYKATTKAECVRSREQVEKRMLDDTLSTRREKHRPKLAINAANEVR